MRTFYDAENDHTEDEDDFTCIDCGGPVSYYGECAYCDVPTTNNEGEDE